MDVTFISCNTRQTIGFPIKNTEVWIAEAHSLFPETPKIN